MPKIEVTFPEVMTSDRSKKIDDVIKSEDMSYISKKRAASMVAKELQITTYDYDVEKKDIDAQPPDRDDSSIQLFPKTGLVPKGQPGPGGNGGQPVSSAPGRGEDMTAVGKDKIKDQHKTL